MTIALGVRHARRDDFPPLARIARAYRLDFLFGVGGAGAERFGIPHRYWYDDEEMLTCVRSNGWKLICLETPEKATHTLAEFTHPEHAIYLLGSDNHTLPASILAEADATVSVETPSEAALPISAVGGIVIHDRYVRL